MGSLPRDLKERPLRQDDGAAFPLFGDGHFVHLRTKILKNPIIFPQPL
jgi:hypothetical protein